MSTLVFTFFVVVAVASLQYLTTSAEDQVSLQADCRLATATGRVPAAGAEHHDHARRLNAARRRRSRRAAWRCGAPSPPRAAPRCPAWSRSGSGDECAAPGRHRAGSRDLCPAGVSFNAAAATTNAAGQATVTWETTDCPPGTTSALIVIYEIESDPYVENMPPNRTVAL
ncbi:MAG: hypothetical protein R2690_17885 [Acidimicrobiales bacterium]